MQIGVSECLRVDPTCSECVGPLRGAFECGSHTYAIKKRKRAIEILNGCEKVGRDAILCYQLRGTKNIKVDNRKLYTTHIKKQEKTGERTATGSAEIRLAECETEQSAAEPGRLRHISASHVVSFIGRSE